MATGGQISLLGRIAVSAKLITQDQLLAALRAQDHVGTTQRLGDILFDLGYITQAQLEWLLNAQQTYLQREHKAEVEAERRSSAELRQSVSADGTIAMPERQARPAPPAAPARRPPYPQPRQSRCSTAFWPRPCSCTPVTFTSTPECRFR